MKRWACIEVDHVLMVVEQDNCPSISGIWVECADHVGPGWVYDGNTFSPPPPPPEPELPESPVQPVAPSE